MPPPAPRRQHSFASSGFASHGFASSGFAGNGAVAGRTSSTDQPHRSAAPIGRRRRAAGDGQQQPGVQAAQGGVGGGPPLPSWNGSTSVAQVAARRGR